MPELPEVEFAVRRLRKLIVGRRILGVDVLHASQRRQFPPRHQRLVVGRRFVAAERRGKHQLLSLSGGGTVLVHFRLDGDWEEVSADGTPPRHARVSFRLGGSRTLSLTDPRALCSISYVAPGSAVDLDLGPEPEDRALTPIALRALLSNRRAPIKPLLLDQRLLAGVGNIYATEACWHARIAPTASASSLSLARVARLLAGLRRTLAVGHRNAARYFSGGQRIPFEAYDREDEPCRRCGALIRRLEQAGRGTWYCPRCQKA